MKTKRLTTVSLLTLFLCFTSFSPMVVNSVPQSIQTCSDQGSSQISIDGSSKAMKIPVWKNEAVLNHTPDTNYHGNTAYGGLWVGPDSQGYLARSFVAFDLTHITKETAFKSARLYTFLSTEFSENDTAIGIYSCSEDTWDETLITWNNQPTFTGPPIDVISNPESPHMFNNDTWYSWDITTDVREVLASDRLLTIMIKNIDENAAASTGKIFAKVEYDQFKASYLELSYTTPQLTQIAVDGFSSEPLLDYVQNSTPIMSWTRQDSDPTDFQYGYEVEVWSDAIFNETRLWSETSTFTQSVFYDNSSQNPVPFSTDDEMRFQFKYASSILNNSGTVDKLHFYVAEDEGVLTIENLVVRMACTSDSSALAGSFEANFGGSTPITVLTADIYHATIHDNILTIDIENTFVMSHALNLIIEVRFTGLSGAVTPAEVAAASSVGSAAYTYGPGAYTSTTAIYLSTRCHSLDIEFASTDIYSTVGTTGSNAIPFNTDDGYGGRLVLKMNRSLVDQSGYIDRIYFRATPSATNIVFEDFIVNLCETPVLGRLVNGTWSLNYGGISPTKVLDKGTYTVYKLGYFLVIDVDNTFYYSNQHDLLVELIWGNKVSGSADLYRTADAGGYRAFDVHWTLPALGDDTMIYQMFTDFIKPEQEVEYNGAPLSEGTRYYWRVRMCDSLGIWTSWSEQSFKYEVLTSAPEWEGPFVSPSPVVLGQSVEVSINVTFFLGVNQVVIEYDSANHTMSNVEGRYSHTWTPSVWGITNFTIFMESAIGTWSHVDGSVLVTGGLLGDPDILAFMMGLGIVAIIAIAVVMKRKKK